MKNLSVFPLISEPPHLSKLSRSVCIFLLFRSIIYALLRWRYLQFCPSCSYFFLLQLEQKNMGDMKITNAWKKGMAYYENYLCLKKSMRDYENYLYLKRKNEILLKLLIFEKKKKKYGRLWKWLIFGNNYGRLWKLFILKNSMRDYEIYLYLKTKNIGDFEIYIWKNVWEIIRGGTTCWCHVQKFACCTTGSQHQYIVIWWEWHYRFFSVLLSRLQHSWMINGEFLWVNYW